MTPTAIPQALAALKPCPLCGAPAVLCDGMGWRAPRWKILCSKNCCDQWPRDSMEEAIALWNARPQEEAQQTLLREAQTALKEIREIYAGMEGSDKTVPSGV